MTAVSTVIAAPPEQVWKVLADGWLYPLWVVGASTMRQVDDHWPAPGARLHHSVGVWPAMIDDTTSSLACEEGSRLELQARAWPAGEARVVLRLRPVPGGTEVVMREYADTGPARLVPHLLQAPLIRARNRESLRRLSALAEGRT